MDVASWIAAVAALGSMVAAFGAWRVASLQNATSRDQLRVALFGERQKVLDNAEGLVRAACVAAALTSEDVSTYRHGVHGARFLFGDEVVSYLNEMGNKAGRLAAV